MSEIIIASVATWKPLGTSSRSVLFIQQSQTGEKGNHECYRSIVPDAQFSLTVPDLITKQIMRNESRHILSIITRLRTGHGSSKEWFERFHLPQDSQECECGDLKTIRHILIVCVWYNDLRQKLKRVSQHQTSRCCSTQNRASRNCQRLETERQKSLNIITLLPRFFKNACKNYCRLSLFDVFINLNFFY